MCDLYWIPLQYQLLLMKASDRGRNVKILGNNFGCV